MHVPPRPSDGEPEQEPVRGDGPQPAVLGPIVGPAVLDPVGVPAGPVIDPPWHPGHHGGPVWSPAPVIRRLHDLPDPEAFLEPGMDGLYAALEAAPPDDPPAKLTPYVPYRSPETTTVDPSLVNLAQIVIKMVEGSAVTAQGASLVLTSAVKERGNVERLKRAGLTPADVRAGVAELNALVAAEKGAIGRAAPQVTAERLALLHRRAEAASGHELPDLNLFFFVHLQEPDAGRAAELAAALRRLPVVEVAYFQPVPVDAGVDIPPTTTIDVTNSQGYFRPAPAGIDVDMARRFAGGHGEGVRICDVEFGWNGHEDLPAVSFSAGINGGFIAGEHGTAVLGELVAQENGFGANGIAPASPIGWSSVTSIDLLMPWRTYFYSVGSALLTSLDFLRAGDIALIEQHYPTLGAGPPPPGSCSGDQFGYVAVETMPFDHAAIMGATWCGVVVVEAAGNGSVPVVPATTLDSGAIVVGASNDSLMPACFTNFGPRVDVHAWGQSIGSLGYGDDDTLRANGDDRSQFYTRTFGGTSGASPIVVGAAALVQGIRAARGLPTLTSVQMRSLLVSTGTPQTPSMTLIGPLPNLAAAIASFVPDGAAFVGETPAPGAIGIGSAFSQSITFRNAGGLPWVGYAMSVSPGDDGSHPWGTFTFGLGTPAAPVMPGDQVTCVFGLHAPAQPATYTLSYRLTNPSGAVLATSPRHSIAVTGPALFDDAALSIRQAPGSVHVGEAAIIIVSARNTGSTTWTPAGYSLRLTRTGAIALPQAGAALGTVPVAPGQTRDVVFVIQGAANPGLGGFTAQVASPMGVFGQSIGKSVVCQSW